MLLHLTAALFFSSQSSTLSFFSIQVHCAIFDHLQLFLLVLIALQFGTWYRTFPYKVPAFSFFCLWLFCCWTECSLTFCHILHCKAMNLCTRMMHQHKFIVILWFDQTLPFRLFKVFFSTGKKHNKQLLIVTNTVSQVSNSRFACQKPEKPKNFLCAVLLRIFFWFC